MNKRISARNTQHQDGTTLAAIQVSASSQARHIHDVVINDIKMWLLESSMHQEDVPKRH